MTVMVGVIVGLAVAGVAAAVALGVSARRRWIADDQACVDDLIAQKGATVRHTGFDPGMRTRTAAKRYEAQQIRRLAAQVESGSEVTTARGRPRTRLH